MAHSSDRIFIAARQRAQWSSSVSDRDVLVDRGEAGGDAMLNTLTARSVPLPTYPMQSSPTEIGLSDLLAFLRRRRMAIALPIVAFVALGILYVTTTPPEYSAMAGLVIDTRKVEIFDKGDVATNEAIPNAAVETELQILRSARIANAVVDKLRLTEDPVFMEGSPEPFGRLTDALSAWMSTPAPPAAEGPPAAPADPERAKRRARGILAEGTRVQRVGLSYAINVSFSAGDPAHASDIANAIVDAYLADQVDRQVRIAQHLSSWLQARIADLRAQGFDADRQAREQSAFRATYDQFLQRYTQALQQESLPTTQTQVIAPAEAPTRPSSPKVPLALAATLVLGTIVGLGTALARDLLDRAIWRRRQLEALAHAPCLGVLPTFRVSRSARRRAARALAEAGAGGARTFAAGAQFSIARNAPFSQFAETLRGTKIAADNAPEGPVNVLGIVSSVPNEGKTTVAINLAQLAAGTERVLLIDGDFRNPTLSWSLVPRGSPGLVQLVANGGDSAELTWAEMTTGLSFLPAGAETRLADGSEILGSARMKLLMDQLRTKFDFIVVDLPPALPVVDVRAAANILDGFAFVVEWGKTTDDVVSQALRDGGLEGRVIGTLLNKVVMSRLRRFEQKNIYRATRGYLEPYKHVV